MGHIADIILASANRCQAYSEGMRKDVRADQFARLATSNGAPVQSNHPAFVFGHLSIYPTRIVALLGGAPVVNPPKFDDLFSNGKPCLDDPSGSIYPAMDIIVGHYTLATDAAIKAVAGASDAELTKANPAEGRMRELFPTTGALTNFLLGAHQMSHLGQVSAWRRFMGLGSAM